MALTSGIVMRSMTTILLVLESSIRNAPLNDNCRMHNDGHLSRRRFLQSTAAAGAVCLGAGPASSETTGSRLEIREPMHGAVLHGRLGRTAGEGLEVDVHGIAPIGTAVRVQGQPAARDGESFHGTAVLKERENDIVVTAHGDGVGSRARVRVLWDRHSQKRYRVVIDDNSFFLRDITQQQYASLFDCFYLKMLRELHTKYGALFTLNIYYTTGDDWNLTQFPARYRDQWQDNAHWLRLAFHAYANDPPRPYQDAPVEKLAADLDLVAREIRRFAGPKTYSPPVVIHWGMTRPEAWKALYERGSRVLGGYFRQNSAGRWDINYRVDDARSAWLSQHDLLKDFESGIIFSKVDMVVNSTPLDRIAPTLQRVVDDPRQAEVVDLLTHEQYFWPFYRNYLPDHAQRMERAIRFLADRGYKPVFLQDGFLGGPV
jgi:hypothetical protein